MTTPRPFAIALAAGLFLASLGAAEPPPGKGKGKAPRADAAKGGAKALRAHESVDGALAALRFAPEHERIIRDWFGRDENLAGLPPGLAKRDRLPPGLEKQLARNGSLPPGLEKKLHPLPGALARRLPPLPDGYRRRILGESVILLDERTSAIIDVLHGVARIASTL